MNIDEARAFLEAAGFKQGTDPLAAQGSIFYYRVLRDVPRPCLTNDKLQIDVHLQSFDYRAANFPPLASVSIRGEYAPMVWAKLDVYSLSLEQLHAGLDAIIEDLLRAWNAMYRGGVKK